MRVVGAVCLIGTNGVQEGRVLFSLSWGVKTWLGGYWQVSGSGKVGRAGLRWVGPRVGAAERAAIVPCRPSFWVRVGGLGGRERGAHRGAGSR